MHSGIAIANTTDSATEFEQKLVSTSTISTIISTKTIGDIPANSGVRVSESHFDMPICSFPINEPNP